MGGFYNKTATPQDYCPRCEEKTLHGVRGICPKCKTRYSYTSTNHKLFIDGEVVLDEKVKRDESKGASEFR